MAQQDAWIREKQVLNSFIHRLTTDFSAGIHSSQRLVHDLERTLERKDREISSKDTEIKTLKEKLDAAVDRTLFLEQYRFDMGRHFGVMSEAAQGGRFAG